MKNHSVRCALIGLCLLWASVGIAGENPAETRFNPDAVRSRFKEVSQAGDAEVGAVAPELEKQSKQIHDVMAKYKKKSAEALPELQADLKTLETSFASVATNITDEKLQAKMAGFQETLLKDAKDGALDEITAGLSAQLKLDEGQLKELQPIFKDHLGKLMAIVEEGQGVGLDGVPALATSLKAQIAENDARISKILKPEQMDELQKARAELRNEVFGPIEDGQVAAMIATLGGASSNAAAIKAVLLEDAKARVDLAEKAADKGKEAADQLKKGLDVVNGDTRSRLKGLVPEPELDKLDAAKRGEEGKLLKAIGRQP